MTTEDLIVAAYKRGFEWGQENIGMDSLIDKAARDYADKTLSSSPIPPSEPVGWRWRVTGHETWVYWKAAPKPGVNLVDEIEIGRDVEVQPLYAVPPSPPRDEVVVALKNIPAPAIDQLRNHQTQLDMDGSQVGVSRQAIDEVLVWIDAALSKLEGRS